MPIITNVDHEHRQVRAIAVGRITYEDFQDHLSLERHFRGLPYPEIIDARSSAILLTTDEARKLGELLREMGHDSKLGPTAVVVADDAAFGVIRMLEMLVEDLCEVKPFRDEQEARAWLSRSVPGSTG